MSKDFVTSIDRAVREHTADNPEPRRGHVGASAIGGRCARQVWYGFRWAYNEQHIGRILRLFSRGHEEEHRFNRWLRMAGVEVQDYSERLWLNLNAEDPWTPYVCLPWDVDPDASGSPVAGEYMDVSDDPHHIALATAADQGPKQWGFTDFQGHFRGSSDGRMRAGPDCRLTLPEGWGLIEEKTHNDKSFKQLTAKGVLTAKPTHYVQMQIYMHYMGLKWGFYYSVNKNDDTLYVEIVHYREEIAMPYIASACKIIEAKSPPAKLTQDPSWFECKFCAFREVCHYGDVPQKNCRSCVFAEPANDGEWRCNKHEAVIPKDFIPQGCKDWEAIG